jgi:hypothetical protein
MNMKTKKTTTQTTLSLLLSGKRKAFQKYAGKHVLVVGNRIMPIHEGEENFWKEVEELEKKYGETPTITFVPRKDISYILLVCY